MDGKIIGLAKPVRLSADASAFLRELADRVDAGEITDLVVAAHNGAEQIYERYGEFSDRWRLLGALEYAKDCVHSAE